ncbi:right-handed parallel beta-helix repeat-containing protein [Branchiibius sp. NY16-3462-2]|uniref:right-handed parallel beta-helix repeat-containing protein n=1 Tax=Branchiibius sp. NY16-3462-2 TaxID=1807500 RepID=UPI0025C67AD6|nr:right-handed parallel beta-helix repeat-containing protein [Branchiibius sp. NY16-3462-2]
MTIAPSKSGLTIQSYPNEAVWLDGTSAVTTWVKQGSVYVHSGWNALFSHNASFSAGQYPSGQSPFVGVQNPMAAWPDGMWIDGVQQRQVASRSAVINGTFFVDYARHELVLGSDPAGHSVRASDVQQAFQVFGSHVTIRGIGIRRYATTLDQLGAVVIQGSDARLRDVVVTDNATGGIAIISPNATLEQVSALGNGATGVGGNKADGITIRNSLIQGNNFQQFNPSPSAAGIKFTKTRGITVAGSVFTGNQAAGLWLDESTVGFAVVNNRFARNWIGAELELSDTGVFANNVVDGGKHALYIYNTGNVQVYNNSFANYGVGGVFMSQDHRRQSNPSDPGHDSRYPAGDPTNPWLTRNITVSNNTFGAANPGMFQVYALDKETRISADAMNLTVKGNQFAPSPTMVGWGGGDNVTVTRFYTPNALSGAKNSSWRNAIATPASVAPTAAGNAVALPLPPSVANKVGVPTGSVQVGPFLSRLP